MTIASTVKVGLLLPYVEGMVTSPAFLRRFLAVAEEAGAESVWAVEHVVIAESYEPRYPYSPDGRLSPAAKTLPLPDPLELLSFAAALTERIVLGTCVVVAPLHSPAVLAKRAATLDRLSQGRFRLGLGIGWQIEEYAAVGAPFDRRGARLEDGIGAMRALWAGAPATYEGAFTSFEEVHLAPRPTAGAVPIVLGGNSAPAIDRAGRIGDGWFPYTLGPEEFATGVAALRRAALRANRPEDVVEITVWPGSFDPQRGDDPALGEAYLTAGAGRLILRPRLVGDDPFATLGEQVRSYIDTLARRAQ